MTFLCKLQSVERDYTTTFTAPMHLSTGSQIQEQNARSEPLVVRSVFLHQETTKSLQSIKRKGQAVFLRKTDDSKSLVEFLAFSFLHLRNGN